MFCKKCGDQIQDGATVCEKCGFQPEGAGNPDSKKRGIYILLGLLVGLLGFPGVHNLYAGDNNRGLIQLLCTILSCWILWVPMYIWAIVEVCTVTADFKGNPMK